MSSTDTNIKKLLAALTIEEKVSLLAGNSSWETSPVERLNIPVIKMTDGPNGARGEISIGGVSAACFPVGVALGATWNTSLVKKVGQALGQETKTKGAHLLLAPTVNIHRSPLAGRNFECFSEDPYLTSRLAVAYINGLQSQNVGATVKHFVCNDSEFERRSISSEVDERTLREIYLPPFEAAVKEARSWAVMASYNKVNSVYASENEYTLRRILKGEWEFEGMVMSDWSGTYSTVDSVVHGLDLEMPGPTQWRGKKLIQAIQDGQVSESTIDAAVQRILRVITWAGAFQSQEIPSERSVDLSEHRSLARQAAVESIVLLKNEGNLLPLSPKRLNSIAIIGPNAKYARVMGGGSSQVNPHYIISPWKGIVDKVAGACEVRYQIGCTNHILTPLLETKWLNSADASQNGFHVDYFNNYQLVGEPVATGRINSTEHAWGAEIARGIERGEFSARLTATFTPDESGEFTFGISSGGLSRFYINGELLLDNWYSQKSSKSIIGMGSAEVSSAIQLLAGQPYHIQIDYSRQSATHQAGFRLGCMPPIPENPIASAVELARQSDVALVFVGLSNEWESEGFDRPNMGIVGDQNALVEAIAASNPNTIVVLQSGAPVSLPWLDRVSGLIQAWYCGQECGNAIADVLFGDADPSGRLPQTYPYRLEDNPAYINYPGENGKVRYGEGIFVGYRYYEKKKLSPMYPFGYGLSYTEFMYSNLKLSSDNYKPSENFQVSVDITNTGDRTGQEVVQLYIRDVQSSLVRPEKELKGFGKVTLQPGETQRLSFSIDHRSLAFYDDMKSAWVAEPGEFEVLLGSSLKDIHQREYFSLEETIIASDSTSNSGFVAVDNFVEVTFDLDTPIGELINNPAARFVLDKHFPGIMDHPQLKLATEMSIRQVAPFAPDIFTEKIMQSLESDLSEL